MPSPNPDSQAGQDTKLHRRQGGKAVLLKEVQKGIHRGEVQIVIQRAITIRKSPSTSPSLPEASRELRVLGRQGDYLDNIMYRKI
jgi:hypothetical protein